MKSQIKNISKYLILFLIQLIEKYEYKHLNLDENDVSKKIVDTVSLKDTKVSAPIGFEMVSNIHKTQPYRLWKINLENGLKLECADNHILFDSLNNQIFVKNLKLGDYIQTKYGLQQIIYIKKTWFKVSMYDLTVNSLDHIYYTNDIISHNTTTVSAFFTWYMCFHIDRTLAILANRQNTAVEIVSKVIDMFKGLPFFLKPGIVNIAQMGLRLDNGCQLMSQATTKTAQIGFAIHVLYADEFAHIPSNIVGDFWRSVYPTLASSSISQCIISSTPAGQQNLFFEIWDKAVTQKNSFHPIRVDYWEIPGHDEAWAAKMRRDFGEEEFAQEFELQFNVDSKLLLGIKELSFMKRLEQEYQFQEMDRTRLDETVYRNLKWQEGFDINHHFSSGDMFVISIDTGDGKEEEDKKDNDSNIISIFQVKLKSLASLRRLRSDERSMKNMIRLVQVGLYRDNKQDEEVTGKIAKALVFDQIGENKCIVLIEMNFNGKQVLRELISHENYSENLVFHTHHTKPIPGTIPPKKKAGFKVSMDKEFFCKLGKKIIGEKTLIVNEKETIFEFGAFGRDKRGKLRGLAAHDDAVMATLNVSRLYNEPMWEDMLFDFLDECPDSPEKRKIAELVEVYEENSDLADAMFQSLYIQEKESSMTPFITDVPEMFKEGEKRVRRYTPGNSFRPRI